MQPTLFNVGRQLFYFHNHLPGKQHFKNPFHSMSPIPTSAWHNDPRFCFCRNPTSTWLIWRAFQVNGHIHIRFLYPLPVTHAPVSVPRIPSINPPSPPASYLLFVKIIDSNRPVMQHLFPFTRTDKTGLAFYRSPQL